MKNNFLTIITTLIFCSIISSALSNGKKSDRISQLFQGAKKNNPVILLTDEDLLLDSTDVFLNSKNQKWKNTGLRVTEGKLLKLKTTLSTSTEIRDYWVIYRLDPRFSRSEVFIIKFDPKKKKYIFDYDSLNINKDMESQEKFELINNYIFFKNREKIPVYKNDVLNITLEDKLPINLNIDEEILRINTADLDNKILYANSDSWCNFITNANCRNVKNERLYYPGKYNICFGIVDDVEFTGKMSTIKLCENTNLGKNFTKDNFCVYGKGLLMDIAVNKNIIKNFDQNFLRTDIDDGKYTFYSVIAEDGELDFLSHLPIDPQDMIYIDGIDSLLYKDMLSLTNSSIINDQNIGVKLLNAGRYIMHVQISNNNKVSLSDFDIEYIVMKEGQNPTNDSGTKINNISYKTDASQDGVLWIKAKSKNENNIGDIKINCIAYKANDTLSKFIDSTIIKPLIEGFRDATNKTYNNLISNKFFQNTVAAVLTLYFVIYGIFFLMGSIKITTHDLVQRVSKVIIVYALFNENSWNFFYNNCFAIFLDGVDYIIKGIVDLTSSEDNIFGFIDPIISRYLNPKLWGLLFIQIIQFSNGLTILAILTIYSILIYLKAIIKIIVQYIIAFLTMSILISLTPLFIIFMLFKFTEGYFFNWISYIFAQMIVPTVVLLIFLFIDQIASLPLSQAVLQANWTWLFTLDIKLPFFDMLPPITQPQIIIPVPFYKSILSYSNIVVPSLLLLIYATIVKNLIEYANSLILSITHVGPGRQEGVRQKRGARNPYVVDAITDVITVGPVEILRDATSRYFSRGSSKDINRGSSEGTNRSYSEDTSRGSSEDTSGDNK